MDPSYQTVVDPADLVFTLIAYAIHGLFAASQIALAGLLLYSGTHALLKTDGASIWSRRLGATVDSSSIRRPLGALRVLLGVGLLAPVSLGAPMAVSLLAALLALLVMVSSERRLSELDRVPGRGVRRLAVACAFSSALFMVWEQEDNLALGADLISSATQWRNEELDWQLEGDPRAPKVGDLAPDFELQDPNGEVRVRLSDFRGKRPVALVFGSYT